MGLQPSELAAAAGELGASVARVIPADSVQVAEWVRWKCRWGCPHYGSNLVCPPYAPAPGETARLLREYREALLFLADQSWRVRYLAGELERLALAGGHPAAFGMGAGPCGLCSPCDLAAPCRHPHTARPSLEACGIDVFSTVAANGLELPCGPEGPRVGLVLLR
ncbi:MAG: DUF2284 domain-containing protein [Thermaerobacter sp.]|nr:DUF2284 domain-containing protein [Thermaerobacter sp.]